MYNIHVLVNVQSTKVACHLSIPLLYTLLHNNVQVCKMNTSNYNFHYLIKRKGFKVIFYQYHDLQGTEGNLFLQQRCFFDSQRKV